jgi:hypothetical protein
LVVLKEAARANGGHIPSLAALAAALADRPTADAILERARLRAQITTSGDLMRAAVQRASRDQPYLLNSSKSR